MLPEKIKFKELENYKSICDFLNFSNIIYLVKQSTLKY